MVVVGKFICVSIKGLKKAPRNELDEKNPLDIVPFVYSFIPYLNCFDEPIKESLKLQRDFVKATFFTEVLKKRL